MPTPLPLPLPPRRRPRLYLLKSRLSPTQRAHFALFVLPADPDSGSGLLPALQACSSSPSPAASPKSVSPRGTGTLINVVGTPMTGFALQVLSDHLAGGPGGAEAEWVELGEVWEGEGEAGARAEESTGGGTSIADPLTDGLTDALVREARGLPPPGRSADFLAPVDGKSNRRCQEWTLELLGVLRRKGFVGEEAVALAEASRDPPGHGVGLRAVGGG